MTEEEWLESTDAQQMLEFLYRREAGTRKYRLFAVACCRRHLHRMQDQASRDVVEVAEKRADGLVSSNALAAAFERISFAAAAYRAHLVGDPVDEFSPADAICYPASASDMNIASSVGAAAEVALAAAVPAEGTSDWKTANAAERRVQS